MKISTPQIQSGDGANQGTSYDWRNVGVVIKQTGRNRYKTHRIVIVDGDQNYNKKETEATSGKMTDVATGESLPITTVTIDTMIPQNKNGGKNPIRDGSLIGDYRNIVGNTQGDGI